VTGKTLSFFYTIKGAINMNTEGYNLLKTGLGFIAGVPALTVIMQITQPISNIDGLQALAISAIQMVFYTLFYSLIDRIRAKIQLKK
jgi:hypothetical protein